MRTLPIILTISLAINAALAVVCIKARNGAAASTHANTKPNGMADSSIPVLNYDLLATALKRGEAVVLLGQLRVLGLPEEDIRGLVSHVIWRKYHNRQHQMLAAKNSARKFGHQGPSGSTLSLTTAERAELRTLAQQAHREIAALFGSSTTDGAGELFENYSFLPPEKARLLMELNREFDELRREISEESMRFHMASDLDKLRLLSAEHRRELEAILTSEELAAYDQLQSPLAKTLRQNLSVIEASEAEYAAVYALLKSVEDAFSTTSMDLKKSPTPEELAFYSSQREAQKNAVEEIKSILGEERYAAYLRAQNTEYKSLLAAADRFQIPIETINSVYALRDTAQSESQRIAADRTLSPEQKAQAFQALSGQIRSEVLTQLGEEVGGAYLERNMTWLKRLDGGGTIKFTESGGYINMRVTPRPAVNSK